MSVECLAVSVHRHRVRFFYNRAVHSASYEGSRARETYREEGDVSVYKTFVSGLVVALVLGSMLAARVTTQTSDEVPLARPGVLRTWEASGTIGA